MIRSTRICEPAVVKVVVVMVVVVVVITIWVIKCVVLWCVLIRCVVLWCVLLRCVLLRCVLLLRVQPLDKLLCEVHPGLTQTPTRANSPALIPCARIHARTGRAKVHT